jgi:membrane-associated phospholipid phosphatase
VRALLGTYTVAMGLTLVYTGEHYVFDIVAGWALAAAVVLAFKLVPRAWAAAMQRVRPEPQRQAETARP